jgi:hypothetical protein
VETQLHIRSIGKVRFPSIADMQEDGSVRLQAVIDHYVRFQTASQSLVPTLRDRSIAAVCLDHPLHRSPHDHCCRLQLR